MILRLKLSTDLLCTQKAPTPLMATQLHFIQAPFPIPHPPFKGSHFSLVNSQMKT